MKELKTIWTGDELILAFPDRDIKLSLEETKLFDSWVKKRIIIERDW